MKLKEKINKDYITALKEKNTISKGLLSVIKGEIQTAEKGKNATEVTDRDVIKILNKTAKSLKETISFGGEQAKIELGIVESYLPTQMTREEITTKVTEVFNSGSTNMGAIMKEFAELPADRKIVSEVARELLK